ncbi:hypothetical protein EVG20_g7310 [Dentipellis fragilis]|uniref:Uncharacterized protein n=1 Tax=Dentipellis fragilis TaxID=205917 RepID=A0A4Y9YFH0_9AGAM|nr:hypothetical protein EVG20_g7310 [Dentipellis fragilis]
MISRFPTELLEQILLQCATRPLEHFDYAFTRPRRIGYPVWISATHVCHQWREIALKCPYMWCHTTLNLSPQWVLAHFQRSADKPLIVELPMDDWMSNEDLCQAFITNIPRVQHLFISGIDERSDFAKILDVRAPRLESLVIGERYSVRMLPDNLFDRDCPRLRYLKLPATVCLWCTSPLLANLRHLEYGNMDDSDNVVSLLHQTPHLETIELGPCLFVFDSHDESPAELPHLTHYAQVAIDPESILGILENLRLPPTVQFLLSSGLEGPQSAAGREADWIRLMDVLSTIFRRELDVENPGPLTHLSFLVKEKWGKVIAWRDSQAPELRSLTDDWGLPSPPAPLSYHWGANRRDVPFRDVHHFCEHMPISSVHTLFLSADLHDADPDGLGLQYYADQGSRIETWLPVLSRMLSLETLKLVKDATRGVLKALAPAGGDDSFHGVLCPGLRTLVIVGAKVHTSEDETILQELTEMLQFRNGRGNAIKELVFEDCHIGPDELVKLSRFANVTQYGGWSRYGNGLPVV